MSHRLASFGHADGTYLAKYGRRDYRGGGRASARETAARVAGGAVAGAMLAPLGVTVVAYTVEFGGIPARVLAPADAADRPFYAPDPEVIPAWETRAKEAMYDRGEEVACGPDCGIGTCDCDRFLEIWNLVFMQFDQIEPGKRVPLPRPSIDTGMGLERIAAVVQGVHSNFDIDLFKRIIDAAAAIAGVAYETNDEHDTALRVISDHSRSVAFLVADGVLPSNEGRGYVLRRLIRRALRFGKLIGLSDPFLYKTAGTVVDVMGEAYPELVASRDFMERMVREEEERFGVTLDKGLAILAEELDRMVAAGEKTITGEFAFKLYDTYGFPLDIVNDVAGKRGIGTDENGYRACMAEQKARAKKAWKGSGETDPAVLFLELLESGMKSRFVGYEQLTAQSRVNALIAADGQAVERLVAGEKGYVVCAVTPFYGESGGQAGDVGGIATLTGDAVVLGTLKAGPELTAQHIEVKTGEILLDQEADLTVDAAVRTATARNHTCTHLLHKALKNVLGPHVNQAGSLVTPERLRFDFTHIAAMCEPRRLPRQAPAPIRWQRRLAGAVPTGRPAYRANPGSAKVP